jgi:uncharacterized protein YllA (UPF0747 family)
MPAVPLITRGFPAGLVGAIGYALYRADGTLLLARKSSGITQVGTVSVQYRAVEDIADADRPAEVRWDDGGGSVASEIIWPTSSQAGGSVSFEKETVTLG